MKIMICYDCSDEARVALTQAEKQARAFKGEGIVVASHVTDDKSASCTTLRSCPRPFVNTGNKAFSCVTRNAKVIAELVSEIAVASNEQALATGDDINEGTPG